MGELDPIAKDQVSGYAMMRADLDALKLDLPLRSTSPATLNGMRSVLTGARRASSGMATSMGQIGLLSGSSSEDLMKVVAAVQLVSGGAQILAALEAVYDLWTAGKIAVGTASLSKYMILAPVIAVAAIGAGVVYEQMISEQTRQFDFQGDYSTPAGQRLMQRQLASTRW